MKRAVKKLIFPLLLVTLSSCSGEDEKASIELFRPDALRQTLAYNPRNLFVEISVNNGTTQSFNVDASSSVPVVQISGVQPNQNNNISIKWIELVDFRKVMLSEQWQVFFADGNTIINAPHVFTIFDNDRDGISNYEERVAGTCVWDRNDVCNTPPPDNISENKLVNGDFSEEVSQWFSGGLDPYTLAGEYCFTHIAGREYWNSYIVHEPDVELMENVEYVMSFDIKADVETFARVGINVDDISLRSIMFREVFVSTNYDRKHVWYTPDGYWADVVFGFGFSEERYVRYCIDNVSLVAIE